MASALFIILSELAEKGARAVVFVPKSIASEDYLALANTSQASYFETGLK